MGLAKVVSSKGRWTLRCAPGEIVLQAADSGGKPLGGTLFLDASPGRHRVELNVNPTTTIAATLRITGVPDDQQWILVAELRRAILTALAKKGLRDRAALDLRQVSEGLGRVTIEGYVALPAPESLTLELSAEWRQRLSGDSTDTIRIKRGRPDKILWSWEDDGSK